MALRGFLEEGSFTDAPFSDPIHVGTGFEYEKETEGQVPTLTRFSGELVCDLTWRMTTASHDE